MKTMLLNLLEYHWVEDIDDALLLLARTDTKTVPLAGGTYLLGLEDNNIQAVVDLRDLELEYITEDAKGIHIGAMTTLQTMGDSPLLKDLSTGILARASLASSFSRLIRNSATLGGTLAAGAASQADLLTVLAVMDAEVVLRSGSKSQVNLSGGTTDRPGLALPDVTFKGKQERRVPSRSIAMERKPNEQIIAAIQMGMADFSPPEDFRASAAYRRVSGMNLAFRVLEEAATISRWRNMVSSKERQ